MQSTEADTPVRAIVCYGPPTKRVKDEPNGERWCFRCRKRREFRFTVDAPTEVSYYGPEPAIRCGTCDTVDGDCFPGGYREWED